MMVVIIEFGLRLSDIIRCLTLPQQRILHFETLSYFIDAYHSSLQ